MVESSWNTIANVHRPIRVDFVRFQLMARRHYRSHQMITLVGLSELLWSFFVWLSWLVVCVGGISVVIRKHWRATPKIPSKTMAPTTMAFLPSNRRSVGKGGGRQQLTFKPRIACLILYDQGQRIFLPALFSFCSPICSHKKYSRHGCTSCFQLWKTHIVELIRFPQ